MRWSYQGFKFGLGMGFLGGLLVASSFSPFIVFALVVRGLIIALVAALLYRNRNAAQLRPRNTLELIVGFSFGAVLLFIGALYYFWQVFLALIVAGVIILVYDLIASRSTMSQASVEVRHLIRNTSVIVAVMAPLLLFVILVIGPTTYGPIPIVGWAIVYSGFMLIVLAKFLEDRRRLATG